MIEILGDLIRTLVLIALVSLILDMLVPGDDYRRYLRMVIGLIILLLVVNAITNFTRRGEVDIFAIADIPVSPAEQGLLAEEAQRIWELNRQQILMEYNRMIKNYLEGEVKQLGGWELTDIELEFANDQWDQQGESLSQAYTYADFGDISMVRAFISSTKNPEVEGAEIRSDISVTVTEVPPVQIGDRSNDHNGYETETPDLNDENHDVNQEMSFIQDHIAGLLQMSPQKIKVIVVTEDTSAQ